LSLFTFMHANVAVNSAIVPSRPFLRFGSNGVFADLYSDNLLTITGPSSFGPGSFNLATSGTGTTLGLDPFPFGAQTTGSLTVPAGYVSGTPLAGTATFPGSLAGQMVPGTYVWSWATATGTDTLTLHVIPEPNTALLLATGLLLMEVRRRSTATR
jgi:hypothetical protein